jgi:hypothetical protein
MKNRDKPMKIPGFCHYATFNEYHGTGFLNWEEIWAAFGYDWNNIPKSVKTQEAYEHWLKVCDTPLFKVLREENGTD